MQAGRKAKGLACGVCVCIDWHAVCRHAAIAALQSQLDGLHGTHQLDSFQTEAIGHHVQHLPMAVNFYFGFGAFFRGGSFFGGCGFFCCDS